MALKNSCKQNQKHFTSNVTGLSHTASYTSRRQTQKLSPAPWTRFISIHRKTYQFLMFLGNSLASETGKYASPGSPLAGCHRSLSLWNYRILAHNFIITLILKHAYNQYFKVLTLNLIGYRYNKCYYDSFEGLKLINLMLWVRQSSNAVVSDSVWVATCGSWDSECHMRWCGRVPVCLCSLAFKRIRRVPLWFKVMYRIAF